MVNRTETTSGKLRAPVMFGVTLLAGMQLVVLATAGEDKVPVPGFEASAAGSAIASTQAVKPSAEGVQLSTLAPADTRRASAVRPASVLSASANALPTG